MGKIRTILLLAAFVAVESVHAQSPTGTIAGNVTDHTGAAVARSRITITSRATGLSRRIITSEEGDYSAPALLPGDYRIIAETAGFTLLERTATVETGTTTTLNLQLHVDAISETVSVETAAPLLRYEHHQVGGLVSRKQIEDLPINGRNYLELVKLEPGVQAPTRASSNRTFVPALGQPLGNSGRGTRVTVDGGSVMAVGNGGSAMGFSQEVVQEFQIATVNFDLTTGLTNGAAINVTTRAGGNDIHGTGFYFFRDHTLDAYPALQRDSANPDPFFQRRQFGFALGGPIRRDRFFFFGAYERNEQRGVVATTFLVSEFAHFNRITPSPYTGNQLSLRLDGRLSDAHNAFIRYSHDGARGVGPITTQPNGYPSTWTRQPGLARQGVVGLTSVFRETLVNDLRFSYLYASSSQVTVTEQECPGCLGVGAPSINVSQGGISLGGSLNQQTVGRRFHLNDYATWQRLGHRFRFGVDWEHHRGGTVTSQHEPATLTLYSPRRVPTGIPLPSAFRTLDDILQLPLQSVTVGIGDPRVLQENGSLVRSWDTLRLFIQDNWRLSSRINVNYGLGWNIDRNLNYDLAKPALLAPLLGGDNLGPTRKKWNNFSPVLGFVWSPDKAAKTVIRAGAGLFYDFLFQAFLDSERALLGPPGSGRQNISGNRLFNCLPGIDGVPVGSPLDFPNVPTRFTGANLLTCLPTIRADLKQSFVNVDQSIQAIQLSKESSNLNPVDVSSPRSLHLNLGIQRAIMPDFVVGADFVHRRFTHFALVDRTGVSQVDLNHFKSTTLGPVIPKCLDEAQRNDPHALCSTGPIVVHQGLGRATYTGLLVRADKRFSHGFQLLGSWAYSSNTGTNVGNGFNIDDWLSNRGPLDRDVTHIVNLASVVEVPWRFQLGFNFSYASTPPFSAFVGGIDFNGDGTTDDLLPGTTVNAFNRSMGRSDLEKLVTHFNETYAGELDEKGSLIPRVTLPKRYSFGDNFQSLDLRLSREFVIRERWRVILMGEVFNLFNAANLSGHSGNLTSPAFGQPTTRFTQVFGSGGPRAFQLGARVSF